VLAVPVPAILEFVEEAATEHLRCVVTDVGSTKRLITAAAARAGLPNFVGGHPMAGGERSGLQHARADLFEGRPWLLVADHGPTAAVDLVERFARGLGASPRRIDAATHDRFMAYVSHVPQLVASALMSAAGQRCGLTGLLASGPAFGEMTRVAGSSYDAWRGTLATNADFVAEALEALVGRLPSASGLRDAELATLFADAQHWRAEFTAALGRGQA
jgi:prephenate dehydrogenase